MRIIKNNQMAEITKRQLAIIRTCPQTLNEMCVALLEEAGRRINPELVRRAAVYIAVSRHGLRPEDLGALLGENWDILDFAHLVAYMSDSFLRRDVLPTSRSAPVSARSATMKSRFRPRFSNISKHFPQKTM